MPWVNVVCYKRIPPEHLSFAGIEGLLCNYLDSHIRSFVLNPYLHLDVVVYESGYAIWIQSYPVLTKPLYSYKPACVATSNLIKIVN